jgi:hypothetical protein
MNPFCGPVTQACETLLAFYEGSEAIAFDETVVNEVVGCACVEEGAARVEGCSVGDFNVHQCVPCVSVLGGATFT